MRLGAADPRLWPFGLRVPLAVALLVLVVSALLTNALLSRMGRAQERGLRSLLTVYLDGLAGTVVPMVMSDDVWQVYNALERSSKPDTGPQRPLLVVVDRSGDVIAASDARRFQVRTAIADAPGFPKADVSAAAMDIGGGAAIVRRPLIYQGRFVGSILARFDVSAAIQ